MNSIEQDELARVRDEWRRCEKDYAALCLDFHAAKREVAKFREREPLVLKLLNECSWIDSSDAGSTQDDYIYDMHKAAKAVRDFKVTP